MPKTKSHNPKGTSCLNVSRETLRKAQQIKALTGIPCTVQTEFALKEYWEKHKKEWSVLFKKAWFNDS